MLTPYSEVNRVGPPRTAWLLLGGQIDCPGCRDRDRALAALGPVKDFREHGTNVSGSESHSQKSGMAVVCRGISSLLRLTLILL